MQTLNTMIYLTLAAFVGAMIAVFSMAYHFHIHGFVMTDPVSYEHFLCVPYNK